MGYGRRRVFADITRGFLEEARFQAEQNLNDAAIGVDAPADAEKVEHWEKDETQTWTRMVHGQSRTIRGYDATVYLDGVQTRDGAVWWSLYVNVEDRDPKVSTSAARIRQDVSCTISMTTLLRLGRSAENSRERTTMTRDDGRPDKPKTWKKRMGTAAAVVLALALGAEAGDSSFVTWGGGTDSKDGTDGPTDSDPVSDP